MKNKKQPINTNKSLRNIITFPKILFHVFFPLFIGASIYILFRVDTLTVFKWIKLVGLENEIIKLRLFFSHIDYIVPKLILFNLPDGLWLYSFTAFMIFTWQQYNHKIKNFWILLPLILSLSGEIGQFFNFVPGTFDYKDLLLYIIFFSLTILFTGGHFYEKNY